MNTIVVKDNSLSGKFEHRLLHYGTRSRREGHHANDDGGGSGGGAGKAFAIAAGVALVPVVAGVGLWWYFNCYEPQQGVLEKEDTGRVVLHPLGEHTEIALMPKLMALAECEDAHPPKRGVDNLTAFGAALGGRF